MGGIAAYVGREQPGDHLVVVEAVVRRLEHGGPDGVATASSGRVAVGHARSAVIDVAGGQQPLRSGDGGQDGEYLVVCNGTIYNHAALRRRLSDRYRFKTHSDAEVVLPLYEAQGAT